MRTFQEAIGDVLLPTLFGQKDPLPSDVRQLVTLTPAQGGLGIHDLRFEALHQFSAAIQIRMELFHSKHDG